VPAVPFAINGLPGWNMLGSMGVGRNEIGRRGKMRSERMHSDSLSGLGSRRRM